MEKSDPQWLPYIQRYKNGGWWARIFRDIILDDSRELEKQKGPLSFLDIGCGGGFDSNA